MFYMTALAALTLLVGYLSFMTSKRSRVTVESVFAVSQALMLWGIYASADLNHPSDRRLVMLTTMALVVYGLASAMLKTWSMSLPSRERRPNYQTQTSALRGEEQEIEITVLDWRGYTLLTAAGIVTTLYFMSVGHITLFESLSSSELDRNEIASLRLESYAGSRYLLPGYVNQFKNFLLPSLIVLHITSQRRSGLPLGPVSWVLVVVAIVSLAGTGQRGDLVRFGLIVLLYLWYLNGRRFSRAHLQVASLVLVLFLVTSSALGRADQQVAEANGTIARVGVLVEDSLQRFTGSNQRSAIAAQRYIDENPGFLLGDWIASLRGMVPGQPGSSLSSEVFASLYGGTRGTSPPSLWTSAYYNLSFAGLLAFAVALAVAFRQISSSSGFRSPRNSCQALGASGIVMTLGTWIAGTPVSLFNRGLPVYVVIFLVGARLGRRSTGVAPSTWTRNPAGGLAADREPACGALRRPRQSSVVQ